MPLSIDELRALANQYRSRGLSTQEIADELSLSQGTIAWLLTERPDAGDAPSDVRIGWRSIGVRPKRMEAVGSIMADIIEEELDAVPDTIVGIAINGIIFANEVARVLDSEMAIHRNVDGKDGAGALSTKYGQVSGKRVVIVDDVLSTGSTMRNTISVMRDLGATVDLCMVLINKTTFNEIDGVPLRGVIRTVSV